MRDKSLEELQKKLTPDVLETIMAAKIYFDENMVGLVDPYESFNFVKACYDIAGVKPPPDWEQ